MFENNTKNVKILLSVPKTILAILWSIQEGPARIFFPHKYARKYCYGRQRATYNVALCNLQRSKLVERKNNLYYLTNQGKKEAFFAYINAETGIHKKENIKWDGKWRLVFFDIPEKKRRHRDYLRLILRAIGFKEFQKSAWIYPYPIPTFLKDLLFEENIKQHTRFVTIDHMDYDKDLRVAFKV